MYDSLRSKQTHNNSCIVLNKQMLTSILVLKIIKKIQCLCLMIDNKLTGSKSILVSEIYKNECDYHILLDIKIYENTK